MLNTPPTFAWYIAGLSFQWLKDQGGVAAIEKINNRKAALLYDCIDQNDYYDCHIDIENRSKMNIVFNLADEERTQEFVKLAANEGLAALKGHREVGGIRASIYNAMPEAGVEALVQFMQEFERTHA
jgi:phosphoserine aminotransferase